MKLLMITAMTILTTAVPAVAQTVPGLKGTWSGPWKTVIYGSNPHHLGRETRRLREGRVDLQEAKAWPVDAEDEHDITDVHLDERPRAALPLGSHAAMV